MFLEFGASKVAIIGVVVIIIGVAAAFLLQKPSTKPVFGRGLKALLSRQP